MCMGEHSVLNILTACLQDIGAFFFFDWEDTAFDTHGAELWLEGIMGPWYFLCIIFPTF